MWQRPLWFHDWLGVWQGRPQQGGWERGPGSDSGVNEPFSWAGAGQCGLACELGPKAVLLSESWRGQGIPRAQLTTKGVLQVH